MPKILNKVKNKLKKMRSLQNKTKKDFSYNLIAKEIWSVLAIVLAGLVVIIILKGIRQDYILVDQFEVPASLVNDGYTGKVIATKIRDEIYIIKSGSVIKIDNVVIYTNSSPIPDIMLPWAPNTLNSVIFSLKELMSKPLFNVSGYIVKEKDKYKLMVNVKGKKKISFIDENEYIGSNDNNIDGMIKSGAAKLYLQIDPLIVAGYYYNNKNYERVLKTFKQMKIDPSYARVSYLLQAKTLFAMRKNNEALDKIKLAYESNGDEKLLNLVYITWGEILRKNNNYIEAINKFESALKINTYDSYSNYMIGDLLILQGKYRDSITYLRTGLEIDKKTPNTNKESLQVITNLINSFSSNTDAYLDPLKMRWNELLMTNM